MTTHRLEDATSGRVSRDVVGGDGQTGLLVDHYLVATGNRSDPECACAEDNR